MARIDFNNIKNKLQFTLYVNLESEDTFALEKFKSSKRYGADYIIPITYTQKYHIIRSENEQEALLDLFLDLIERRNKRVKGLFG